MSETVALILVAGFIIGMAELAVMLQSIIKPAPAEHVIEIRTKRRDTGTIRACHSITTGEGQPCEIIKKGTNCPQGAECSNVYDETREVWIDGKRWGVLKESGQ